MNDTENTCNAAAVGPSEDYHSGYRWALVNLDQEGVQADRARFIQDELTSLREQLQASRHGYFQTVDALERANKERDDLRIRVKQVEDAHAVAERLRARAERAMQEMRETCREPHLGYATNAKLIAELACRYENGSVAPDYRTVDLRP